MLRTWLPRRPTPRASHEMRRTNTRGAVSARSAFPSMALILILVALPASAANPGPLWEQLWHSEEGIRDSAAAPALRYLADGSLMAVSRSFAAVEVVRWG